MLEQQREMAKFFLCPLSQEIMFDPVIASDGKTYEREKIEEYIASKKGKTIVSPMDGKTEITVNLTSNDAMRSMIQQFLVMNPVLKPELYFSETIKQEAEKAVNDHNEGKLKQLIEKEPRLLETSFGDQGSLLLLAAKKGNLACLKLVIGKLKSANLFNLDQAAQQAFLGAAYQNKQIGAAGVKEIIQSVLSWEKEKIYDFLKSAITVGNTVLVEALVKGNVVEHVDTVLDDENNTALHLAASQNQAPVAQLLINLGANTKVLNKENEKPEQVAFKKGHKQLAKDIGQWRQNKKIELISSQVQQHNQQRNSEILTDQIEKLQQRQRTLEEQNEQLKLLVETLKKQNEQLQRSFETFSKSHQQEVLALKDTVNKLQENNTKLQQSVNPAQTSAGMFSASAIARKPLKTAEQKLQNTFVESILNGDFQKVQAFHKEGALLHHLDHNNMYPLVAAYSLNTDILKYIEDRLGSQAEQYWSIVDISEVEKIATKISGLTLENSSARGWFAWLGILCRRWSHAEQAQYFKALEAEMPGRIDVSRDGSNKYIGCRLGMNDVSIFNFYEGNGLNSDKAKDGSEYLNYSRNFVLWMPPFTVHQKAATTLYNSRCKPFVEYIKSKVTNANPSVQRR